MARSKTTSVLSGKAHVSLTEAAEELGMDSEGFRQFAVRHSLGPRHITGLSPFILIERVSVLGHVLLRRGFEDYGRLLDGRLVRRFWGGPPVLVIRSDANGNVFETTTDGESIPRQIPLRWTGGLCFPPEGEEDGLRWRAVAIPERPYAFFAALDGVLHLEHDSFQLALSRIGMSIASVNGGARRWLAARSSYPFGFRIPDPRPDEFPQSLRDPRVRIHVEDLRRLKAWWRSVGGSAQGGMATDGDDCDDQIADRKRVDKRIERSIFQIVGALIELHAPHSESRIQSIASLIERNAVCNVPSTPRLCSLLGRAVSFRETSIGTSRGLTREDAELLCLVIAILSEAMDVPKKKIRSLVEAAVRDKFRDDAVVGETVRRTIRKSEAAFERAAVIRRADALKGVQQLS